MPLENCREIHRKLTQRGALTHEYIGKHTVQVLHWKIILSLRQQPNLRDSATRFVPPIIFLYETNPSVTLSKG